MRGVPIRRAVRRLRLLTPPRAAGRRKPDGPGATLTLTRSPHAVLDRFLPARAGPFIAVALAIGAVVWALGWWLAADRGRMLASREWIVQPLYLAVHLALLRAFVSVYAANFELGVGHLDVAKGVGVDRVQRALGWRSVALAALVAAPLVVLDVRWITGSEFLGAREGLGVGGVLGAADGLMVGVWAVEWLVNAYVWVLIVAFLWHTLRLLETHTFRDPIEKVLRERQYRPFLLMSAQGASLAAAFAVANFAYVELAEGATSDYVGLWVTAGAVLLGFVPPWMLLRSRVRRHVAEETDRLGEVAGETSEQPAAREDSSPRALAERLDTALAILRIEHLDRLHAELGKSEAQSVVFKLVAPILTVMARVVKPF